MPYAKIMVGRTNCIVLMTVISIIPTVLLPKGMGAQEAHERTDIPIRTIRVRENAKGQIMLS